jgi:NCS1 family nucleobase:cation symporter-1
LASFVGIAVTSAGISLYGQILWDPLKLIDHWDNRACAFFASLTFSLSTLASNISVNSLDAGNEMAALYPRYINIRRGQVICAFLGGWVLCPWKILARWDHHQNDIHFLTVIDSAPGFLTFVSGYAVFFGPMAAIIVTDVCPALPPDHQHGSNLTPLSTGLYIAPGSTFLRCIGLVAGIGTPME